MSSNPGVLNEKTVFSRERKREKERMREREKELWSIRAIGCKDALTLRARNWYQGKEQSDCIEQQLKRARVYGVYIQGVGHRPWSVSPTTVRGLTEWPMSIGVIEP